MCFLHVLGVHALFDDICKHLREYNSEKNNDTHKIHAGVIVLNNYLSLGIVLLFLLKSLNVVEHPTWWKTVFILVISVLIAHALTYTVVKIHCLYLSVAIALFELTAYIILLSQKIY